MRKASNRSWWPRMPFSNTSSARRRGEQDQVADTEVRVALGGGLEQVRDGDRAGAVADQVDLQLRPLRLQLGQPLEQVAAGVARLVDGSAVGLPHVDRGGLHARPDPLADVGEVGLAQDLLHHRGITPWSRLAVKRLSVRVTTFTTTLVAVTVEMNPRWPCARDRSPRRRSPAGDEIASQLGVGLEVEPAPPPRSPARRRRRPPRSSPRPARARARPSARSPLRSGVPPRPRRSTSAPPAHARPRSPRATSRRGGSP